MRKNLKIFNNNLKSKAGTATSKLVPMGIKLGTLGKVKYLPSFTKEWKNTIYSFNKNIMKNIPVNNLTINKIIKSYFNLYFKNNKFIGDTKNLLLKKRRNLLKRIFVSDAEIKYNNNKAVITLYVVNREKKILKKKYDTVNYKINRRLFKRSYLRFISILSRIYTTLRKYNNKYFFVKDIVTKKSFLNYKLTYLNTFLNLKQLYLKKFTYRILRKRSLYFWTLVRKFHLAYSLNQYKFNKLRLLPKLSSILTKILGRKVEYNIINLKSITYHTDIFTNVLALKLKNLKNHYMKNIFRILNRAYIPTVNTIAERTFIKHANLLPPTESRDSKITSYLSGGASSDNENLDEVLNNLEGKNINKNIHNLVYNSIRYKNMGGIRLEVKGRLTKRYRADKSVYFVKWKGGLKNIDSSFQGLTSVLYRGNTKSNTSYSLATGKRRIGAFAVKGWIGGK
jgi:hypothetical protein